MKWFKLLKLKTQMKQKCPRFKTCSCLVLTFLRFAINSLTASSIASIVYNTCEARRLVVNIHSRLVIAPIMEHANKAYGYKLRCFKEVVFS